MLKFVTMFAVAMAFVAPARAQTELSAYADKNGYVNMNELTCAQLAHTFQEDANFLGVWYSGWYNGLAKKSSINIPRVKEGVHEVIVYCKAHQDKKIIEAIGTILEKEKERKGE
ncbi:HdeA/HdeB family chaperone [Beijerinckia mobilis]|uniref:HdeA/HdeB family chaperone n=1 Tax=Beijerinckia mobilis TaxID=231434 RepID=UPI0005569F6D|nr:HdeA/HdeB family chaperone [Beijerinckia mobilis]